MENQNLTKRLRTAGIILAILSIVICIINWRQLTGLEYGFFYGIFSKPSSFGEGVTFAHVGPDYRQWLNIWYFEISVSLAVFLITKLFRNRSLTFVVAGTALCLTIFPFYLMMDYKLAFSPANYRSWPWLKQSITLDWIAIVSTTALLVIEIMIFRINAPAPKVLKVTD